MLLASEDGLAKAGIPLSNCVEIVGAEYGCGNLYEVRVPSTLRRVMMSHGVLRQHVPLAHCARPSMLPSTVRRTRPPRSHDAPSPPPSGRHLRARASPTSPFRRWFPCRIRRSEDATDLSQMDTARAVVERLYAKTGLAVGDMGVAEVHDCFSIAELLVYEAIGLAPHGRGAGVCKEGRTHLGGEVG